MKTIMTFLFLAVGVPIAMVAVIVRPSASTPARPVQVTAATVQVAPAASASVAAIVAPTAGASNAASTFGNQFDAPIAHLRDYVLDVMKSWPKGSKELPTANLDDVALDITGAVLIEPTTIEIVTGKSCSTVRNSDRCFWGSSFNTNGAKAVLLAALAYWEGSRFVDYADRSLCTNKTWRKTEEGRRFMRIGGDCDGGYAFSLWQIHPIEAKDSHGSHIEGVCDHEHVAPSYFDGVYGNGRFFAARCALELARESMTMRGNLSRYTGESGYEHPKADERLEFARATIKKHPWAD